MRLSAPRPPISATPLDKRLEPITCKEAGCGNDHAARTAIDREDESMSSNSGPGYRKHPAHLVATQPAAVRVQVTFNRQVIADSREAIRLDEGGYAPVYYIPRKDVKMERLTRTDHQTYCPFKGDASYYSILDGPRNAAWTYERPYDEVLLIKDHLAFYPDKASITTEET
jgi:uncharacterized protein (DUF427 family)